MCDICTRSIESILTENECCMNRRRMQATANREKNAMHIPSCETVELCLPDFETALKDALLPNDRYDARRWLYVPNLYTEYRYILGTRGKKPLICVGINPSTAAPAFQHPLQNRVPRVQVLLPLPSKKPLLSARTKAAFVVVISD